MTIHLPNDFNDDQMVGTACGLVFGREDWGEGDVVLTDRDDPEQPTCPACQSHIHPSTNP